MKLNLRKYVFLLALLSVFILTPAALGQSTDQALPTPVLSNEISGEINALDLGDPRLTRHFYAFAGSPGDLLITVESKNLNGDIDVFTAVTFRPLMKTTFIATPQAREITRGIYLRAHQILILRVEARTPSDEPGTYHIRFGGTFERFSGGIPVAEAANTETGNPPEKSGANRLSSVGATIPRPVTETAEAEAKPTPSPEKAAETPAEKAPSESETARKTTSPSRRTTGRQTPRRGTRPAPAKSTETATKTEPAAKTEAENPKTETSKPVEEKTVAEKPTVTEQPAETSPPAEKPKSQDITAGTHLIIEEKDGTKIDRPMSTVRRIVVEGNTIVILLKSGKIERIAMTDVSRMSIEPQ